MKMTDFAAALCLPPVLYFSATVAIAMDKEEFIDIEQFDQLCAGISEDCLGVSGAVCSDQIQKCLSAVPEFIDEAQMEQVALQVGMCFNQGEGLDYGTALGCKVLSLQDDQNALKETTTAAASGGYGFSAEYSAAFGLHSSSALPPDMPYSLYPNSRFIQSIPPTPQINIAAVVLLAPHEFDRILTHYRKSLPDWTVYQKEGRAILLSKEIPSFTLDKPSPLRLVVPHIDIDANTKDPVTLKPAAKITMFYESKES